MSFLGNDTIVILDAPLVADGRYGSDQRDWDNASATTLEGCSVQPYTGGAELTRDREFTATHVRLFAPYGAVPTATSRVVHDGITYEVDGEPDRWRDDGTDDHIEAALKRLDG